MPGPGAQHNKQRLLEQDEATTPRREEKKQPDSVTSPTVTQFAQNPYMNLRTKPSDEPNSQSFFSLMMTKQSSTAQRKETKSSMTLPSSGHQIMPNTSRQANTFQQFYESIAKPFFSGMGGSSGLIKPGTGPVRSMPQSQQQHSSNNNDLSRT